MMQHISDLGDKDFCVIFTILQQHAVFSKATECRNFKEECLAQIKLIDSSTLTSGNKKFTSLFLTQLVFCFFIHQSQQSLVSTEVSELLQILSLNSFIYGLIKHKFIITFEDCCIKIHILKLLTKEYKASDLNILVSLCHL